MFINELRVVPVLLLELIMDEISDILKVYPLNIDPATWNRIEPRRPAAQYSSSFPPSGFLNSGFGFNPSINYQPEQSDQPIEPSTDYVSIPRPDLRPLVSNSPETLSELELSETWNEMPISRGNIMTRAKAASLANQASKSAESTTPTSSDGMSPPTSVIIREKSSRPRMPALVDARDDVVIKKEKGTDKTHRGGQRSPGPMSSHAVYARMNRERKKKYLQELEEYKQTMTKKSHESHQELEQIHKETASLVQEIASLRNELVSNQSLMSLLNMGRQGKE